MGNPVIMGRKTFETLKGPLDGRENIVITRNTDYKRDGITIVHSFEEAVERCKGKKAFVIGGQSVYEAAMRVADRVEITRVHKNIEGDSFFPDMPGWVESTRQDRDGYSFITYVKQRLF